MKRGRKRRRRSSEDSEDSDSEWEECGSEEHARQLKRASLTAGCFPNLDVTRGYISVRNFHQFFPDAVPDTRDNNNNNNDNDNDNDDTLQRPPELNVSDLMPVTYNDYITQTIQASLVNTRSFTRSST